MTVKPKLWKKPTDSQENWTMWVVAISGQMGALTQEGFVLDQIQVFEKKPKVVEAPVEH